MANTRSRGPGLMIGGATGVGLALLGTLGGVATGWLPWTALPVAWLGGNAGVLLAAHALTKPAEQKGRVVIRGYRANSRAIAR